MHVFFVLFKTWRISETGDGTIHLFMHLHNQAAMKMMLKINCRQLGASRQLLKGTPPLCSQIQGKITNSSTLMNQQIMTVILPCPLFKQVMKIMKMSLRNVYHHKLKNRLHSLNVLDHAVIIYLKFLEYQKMHVLCFRHLKVLISLESVVAIIIILGCYQDLRKLCHYIQIWKMKTLLNFHLTSMEHHYFFLCTILANPMQCQ